MPQVEFDKEGRPKASVWYKTSSNVINFTWAMCSLCCDSLGDCRENTMQLFTSRFLDPPPPPPPTNTQTPLFYLEPQSCRCPTLWDSVAFGHALGQDFGNDSKSHDGPPAAVSVRPPPSSPSPPSQQPRFPLDLASAQPLSLRPAWPAAACQPLP